MSVAVNERPTCETCAWWGRPNARRDAGGPLAINECTNLRSPYCGRVWGKLHGCTEHHEREAIE